MEWDEVARSHVALGAAEQRWTWLGLIGSTDHGDALFQRIGIRLVFIIADSGVGMVMEERTFRRLGSSWRMSWYFDSVFHIVTQALGQGRARSRNQSSSSSGAHRGAERPELERALSGLSTPPCDSGMQRIRPSRARQSGGGEAGCDVGRRRASAAALGQEGPSVESRRRRAGSCSGLAQSLRVETEGHQRPGALAGGGAESTTSRCLMGPASPSSFVELTGAGVGVALRRVDSAAVARSSGRGVGFDERYPVVGVGDNARRSRRRTRVGRAHQGSGSTEACSPRGRR